MFESSHPFLIFNSRLEARRVYSNLFYHFKIDNDLREYAKNSNESRTEDRVAYFDSVGSYQHQWAYLWFILGF